MPVTKLQIQTELTGTFPNIAADTLYTEMVEVGYFLANGTTNNAFLQALRGLEADLEEEIRKRMTWPWKKPDMAEALRTARGYWQGRNQGTQAKDQNFSHLLTTVLTKMEDAEGFSFRTWLNKKAQLYVSVIDPTVFRSQLASGYHWKDPGVPGSHGEFTHRIQWYLICKSGILGARGTAADVFKRTAQYVVQLMPAVNGATETDLWQALCDRDRYNGAQSIAFRADSTLDFRCPEHFNEYMTNSLSYATYPVLRSFLVARFQKRQNFDPQEYVAAKLFQKPYASLNRNEKATVLGQVGGQDIVALHLFGNAYAGLSTMQQQKVDGFIGSKPGILKPR